MVSTHTIAMMLNLASAELYCPSKDDMVVAYGAAELYDGGWTVTGSGGAALKSTFNLVGDYDGYIEYDIDLSGTSRGINANLFGIFPNVSGSHYDHSVDYCDGGRWNRTLRGPWCPELDFIESNGQCAYATTWHTINSPEIDGCTYWGCGRYYGYRETATFHMRIDFQSNGSIVVKRWGNGIMDQFDGDHMGPKPNVTDWDVIKAFNQANGFAVVSTQSDGWVPDITECWPFTPGNISNSSFSVSNLKIAGKVVQGPTPSLCSEFV